MNQRYDIIETLRKRRGMDADDASDDEFLLSLPPQRAFEDCCAFHLGDPLWSEIIFRWLRGAGYIVPEKGK